MTRNGTTRLRKRPKRHGVAFMLALFVMVVCSMIVVATLDTQMLQYSSLRNTMDYDRARYLAEAAVQEALANLELDYAINTPGAIDAYDIPQWRDFPGGNGQYAADLTEGPNGTVIIEAQGQSGQFIRRLEITVKMGG